MGVMRSMHELLAALDRTLLLEQKGGSCRRFRLTLPCAVCAVREKLMTGLGSCYRQIIISQSESVSFNPSR